MKTTTIKFILLFSFLYQVSSAQPGFNIIKDFEWQTNHFRDMIVDNDTIIGYGMAYDTVTQLQGLLLAKFDSSGNFIASKLILDSQDDFLSIDKHWGKIIKTSDGGYAMTAATFFRNSALLIKLNYDLEVEFIKEYPDTVNLAHYRYTPVEINEGYLLFGGIQRPNFLDDGFIRRVDKQGNTVWFNYYGVYNQDDAIVDLKMVNDSIAVVASVDGVNGSPTGSSRSTLRYINLDGEVLQTWASEPEPEIGYLRKVIPTGNGGLITYGVYVANVTPLGTKMVQSTIARFTQDFQMEWVEHYGYITSIDVFLNLWDIEPTADGNFIGAGSGMIPQENTSDASSGWLFKFSPEGDSVWSRYDVAPFPFKYYNYHFLSGVGVLSSGNIVAAGRANEGQKTYMWLVKVTNDGCLDTLFCGLVGAGEAVPERAVGDVKVFPNPATEEITVEVEGGFLAGQVRLHDVSGRLVRRLEVPQDSSQFKMPVAHLAAGVYFLELRFEDGRFLRRKVVVGK